MADGARRTANRLSRAGLAALGLLLLLDHAVLGDRGPWAALAAGDEWSPANLRLSVLELRDGPAGRARVVAAGDSRVFATFVPRYVEGALPEITVARLSRPAIATFGLRALCADMIRSRPDAVVLMLSEFDTHRPLRLGIWPQPSLAAIADLLAATGPAFVVEQRTAVYRLFASAAYSTYSYREFLGSRLVAGRERFARDDRLVSNPRRLRYPGPTALGGGAQRRVPAAARRAVFDLYPPMLDFKTERLQIALVQEITPGSHVPVQMSLLRSTVRTLRSAGIEVVVVESALHPATGDLYDQSLRREFLAFAQKLAGEQGVHFVSVDDMGEFAESDFVDILHVNQQGAEKVLRGVANALSAAGVEGSRRSDAVEIL